MHTEDCTVLRVFQNLVHHDGDPGDIHPVTGVRQLRRGKG